MSSEPPKYQLLDPKIMDEWSKLFTGVRKGFVQVGETKLFLPERYTEFAEKYHNFKVRPDDVFVVTFPRSGTTWTLELVWLLSNNLDFKSARDHPLLYRAPFFEMDSVDYPGRQFAARNNKTVYEMVDEMPSPRVIKSHFPLSLLPGVLDAGCKIVYVARSPKDVAVSYYHFSKSMVPIGYRGDFATFWDLFERNLLEWTPHLEHLKEAWALRHQPNMLFLFYEEMKLDLSGVIRRVAQFLDKTLTEEQLAELADHLDINNFRNNSTVNMLEVPKDYYKGSHVRNGQVGGWKDYFTPELEARADKWIEDNLKDTDLTFPFFDNKGK